MDTLWWQHGVIYQIYPRSFKDSNGDGTGDLRGIIEKLPYFRDILKVDALWLSPFFPSPMADFGYDVSDYVDVDPIFGDLATLDELITKAHALDVKIIIDFVPNHSSDQHAWFKESRSSRDNPKRDWYVWRDAKPDGSPPNNWLGVFGGSAWEWDDATSQYYLHSFLPEQPDLNWRNPEVKAAMFDVIRFWLERGVDGFRVDTAHYIMKDPDLRDNPLNESANTWIHKPMGAYDSQNHLYDKGHTDVHGMFREIRQIFDEYSAKRPRVIIGEIHIFDWSIWTSFYGGNLDELHLPFNFALLGVQWQAAAVRKVVNGLEGALPKGAWANYVLGNHDESRIASRIGKHRARLAMMLLLTLRGTPTMYYGDELGMLDVPIPEDKVQDPWGKNVPGFGLGRDPERTPMQWDEEPNAGFTPARVEPWLPVSPDYQQVNVATELDDPFSMLNMTRQLLQLRRNYPALAVGDYQEIEQGNENCLVFQRKHGSQKVLVILNFSDESVKLNLSGEGIVLMNTTLDREGEVDLAALILRGNEGFVIALD